MAARRGENIPPLGISEEICLRILVVAPIGVVGPARVIFRVQIFRRVVDSDQDALVVLDLLGKVNYLTKRVAIEIQFQFLDAAGRFDFLLNELFHVLDQLRNEAVVFL